MSEKWLAYRKFTGLLSLMTGFICSFLVVSSGFAETYYVGKSGNDSNSCGSAENENTPKKTIVAGIGCLSAGDALIIKGGTYAERIINGVASGTSWENATTIKAAEGETVILQPIGLGRAIELDPQKHTYVIFDGLVVDGSKVGAGCGGTVEFGGGSEHIIFRNGEVRNINGDAFGIGPGTQDIRVINNKIHDLFGNTEGAVCRWGGGNQGVHGFYWQGSTGLIEYNEIYNATGHGLQFYYGNGSPGDVDGSVMRNNIIHNVDKPGIYFGSNSTNNLIYNNIIYNGSKGVKSGGSNNKIYNNTIYNMTEKGIKNTGSENSVVNNIVYKANGIYGIGGGTTNFTDDPKFVNPEAGDFRIMDGSPAIDFGTTLAEVGTDFAGFPRPQGQSYDIGAFEFIENMVDTEPPAPPVNLKVVQ